MPNKNTFDIVPIKLFVEKYLNNSNISIDPFARNFQGCIYTNDLNSDTKAQYHMKAEDFLQMLIGKEIKADLILFDPPYSPRQISECYKKVGLKVGMEGTQNASLYKKVRDKIDLLISDTGIVLSFGWNSVGMGKKRGFKIIEILLVCHGGAHNDTICMAEKNTQTDEN